VLNHPAWSRGFGFLGSSHAYLLSAEEAKEYGIIDRVIAHP
jgi:hypothetical protein